MIAYVITKGQSRLVLHAMLLQIRISTVAHDIAVTRHSDVQLTWQIILQTTQMQWHHLIVMMILPPVNPELGTGILPLYCVSYQQTV